LKRSGMKFLFFPEFFRLCYAVRVFVDAWRKSGNPLGNLHPNVKRNLSVRISDQGEKKESWKKD